MKKLLSVLTEAVLLLLVSANFSNAALISYWNFNAYNASDTTLAADVGSGTMSFLGFSGDTDDFGGSTVNAVTGNSAGLSLSLINQANNGEALTIHISGSGLSGFILSYATQRTTTGFNSQQWAYSTDNSTFVNFSTIAPPTSYELRTVDFSSISELNDAEDVYFRVTFSGASATTGNNRIDNLQINAVPEPTTWAGLIFGTLFCGVQVVRRWRVVRGQPSAQA